MSQHAHEWPLVAFTSLAIAGAGIVAIEPLRWVAGVPAVTGWKAAGAWGPALIALGLLVSVAHLGRPARLFQVRRGVRRSALSNEVMLAGGTVAVSAVAALVSDRSAAGEVLRFLAAVLATAFLVSLGFVYRLKGQRTWEGPAVAGPVVSGLALGAAVLAASDAGAGWPVVILAAFLLGVDAGVFAVRWAGLGRLDPPLRPAHSSLFPWRHLMLGLRLTLFDILSVGLLVTGRKGAAVAALAAGIAIDRLAFYLLAVQHTTEAEIARAEWVIAGLDSLPAVTLPGAGAAAGPGPPQRR
jgi:DMSO reductase anchor subunit